ncbi:hypothetical protein [Streptomyces sp. NBC_01497]|uniref:hypothetical protein n=1 Tax=Streptomyces sp. NBC_01497 TaxID=2903885 RepID=UPI002E2F3442|nr:hypothetical protein [Streptomyces sp. NBC_01497]
MQRRLLWLLGVGWEKATEAEAAAMDGWLRTAKSAQHRRSNPSAPPPGSVNTRTGKQYLKAGYEPTTINALTVVSRFYAFHRRYSRGAVVNPVPESVQRRRALAHRSPDDPMPLYRRGRLRQRTSQMQLNQTERWWRIQDAPYGQTSGVMHDDAVTRDFEYSRAEAETLLAMAADLLRNVPEQLPDPVLDFEDDSEPEAP